MSDQDKIRFSDRKVETVLPSDQEMAIRVIDWKRIYRKVCTLPKTASFLNSIKTTLLAVSISAFLGLFPLYSDSAVVALWVFVSYWVVGLVFGFLALMAFLFIRERGDFNTTSTEEVKKDMQDVYECFFPTKKLENECA